MEFRNIKKRNLYEEITNHIVRFVDEHGLQPGDKLPTENEMVKIFGVSKTAIREALSVLAAKGIIEKKAGVGSILIERNSLDLLEKATHQLKMQKQTLQEVLEFRRGIEVEAAAFAAQRATEEQLQAIENAHRELIEINNNGGVGIEEDYRFHYLIILATGNSFYETMFDVIAPHYFEAIKISKIQSHRLSNHYLQEAHTEHQAILNALKSNDEETARIAMRNHLLNNETKIWSNDL